jgi:hypothetical protein
MISSCVRMEYPWPACERLQTISNKASIVRIEFGMVPLGLNSRAAGHVRRFRCAQALSELLPDDERIAAKIKAGKKQKHAALHSVWRVACSMGRSSIYLFETTTSSFRPVLPA